MACRAGCETQDHRSWGECAKAANLRIAYCGIGGGDATAQKSWDGELAAYRAARTHGIQPDGTSREAVELAVRASERTGLAYGRDFAAAAPMEG